MSQPLVLYRKRRQTIFYVLVILFLSLCLGLFGATNFAQAQAVVLNQPVANCNSAGAFVVLSWVGTDVGSSPEYYVLRSPEGQTDFVQLNSEAIIDDNSYTDNTIVSDQAYSYKIKVVVSGSDYFSDVFAINKPYCPVALSAPTTACDSQGPSVNLSWQPASGVINRYEIWRNGIKVDETTQTVFVDTADLVGEQVYQYMIKAIWQDGHQADSPIASATIPLCPVVLNPPIANCLSVAPGGPQIDLTWNNLPGATQYLIYRQVSGSGDFEFLVSNSQPQWQDNLVNSLSDAYWQNLNLSYKVKAVFLSANQTDFSNIGIMAIPSCVPFLNIQAACDISLSPEMRLQWTIAQNASQYSVYRKDDGVFGFQKQIIGATNNSYIDHLTQINCPGNVCAKTYKIEAVPGGESLEQTQSVNCSAPQTPTPAPNLNAPSLYCGAGGSTILITWQASAYANSYSLTRLASGLPDSSITISDTFYEDSSVQSGQSYTYFVTAIGQGGTSTVSENVKTVVAVSCIAPSKSILTLTNDCQAGVSVAHLSWTATTNTLEYRVSRGIGVGEINDLRAVFYAADPEFSTRLWQEGGLNPNTTYRYKITAVGPSGLAPVDSDAQSLITGNCFPTTPVLTLVATCQGLNTAINLSWATDMSNTTGYEIYRQDLGINPIQIINDKNIKLWQDLTVTANNTYTYYVTAIGYLVGQRSNSVSQSLMAAYCQAPGNFVLDQPPLVCQGAYPQTQINWSNSTGVETYDLIRRKISPLTTETTNNVFTGLIERGLGKALKFDGSNDYASVVNNQINGGAGGYNTVSFWMYFDSSKYGVIPFSFYTTSYYDFYIYSSVCAGFNTGNGDVYGFSPATANIANQWSHITLLFYNGFYTNRNKIYVNGQEQVLNQCVGAPRSGTVRPSVSVGRLGSSNYYFKGLIDELRIYNRALSAPEIASVYQGTFNDSTNLAGLWHFDEGQGQAASNSDNTNVSISLGSNSTGADTADPTWQDSGLQAGSQYDWQVRANNFSGSTLSNRSAPLDIGVCDPVKPGLLLAAQCTTVGADKVPSVRLRWSFSLNAQRFEIHRSDQVNPIAIFTQSAPASPEFISREWTDTNLGAGLMPLQDYAYWVTAVSASGVKTESDHLSKTTFSCEQVGVPGNVTATFECNGNLPRVRVAWDSVINTDYYIVFRQQGAGVVSSPQLLTAPYLDTSINVNTAYNYWVVPYGDGGPGASSEVILITVGYCPPSVPQIVSLNTSCVSVASVNDIRWMDDTFFNSISYEIYRDSVKVVTFDAGSFEFDNRQWQDNLSLIGGTNYTYQIKAIGPVGASGLSPSRTTTTLMCGVPNTPSLTLDNNSCVDNINQPRWSWTSPPGFSGYSYNMYRINPDNSVSTYATIKSPFTDRGDYASDFDGTNDYVRTNDAFAFNNQSGALSFEFWAKSQRIKQYQTLISDTAQSATQGYVWIFRYPNTNNLVVQYSNGTIATAASFTGYFTGFDNTWMHIIVVADYSQRNLKVYRNGVLFINRDIGETMIFPNRNLYKCVGAYNSGLHFWKGSIDEVRVYERALSGAEVSDHYSNIYKNEAGLKWVWHFNESSGAAVHDGFGGIDGTVFNGALWQMPNTKPGFVAHPYSSSSYKYQIKGVGVNVESLDSNQITLDTQQCLNNTMGLNDLCTFYNEPITILNWQNKKNITQYEVYKNGGQAETRPTTDFISPIGLIKHWLLLDAYDNSADAGLTIDFLNTEDRAKPRANQTVDSHTWRDYYSNTDQINLYNYFSPNTFRVGYAFTYIYSPSAQNVRLRLGSYDSARVWLNGALKIDRPNTHQATRYEEVANVSLQAGLNTILVKSAQTNDGQWQFDLRLTDGLDNNILNDLTWWDSQSVSGVGANYYIRSKINDEISLNSNQILSQPLSCLPLTPELNIDTQCDNDDSQIKINWIVDPGQTLSWVLKKKVHEDPPPPLWQEPWEDVFISYDGDDHEFIDGDVASGEIYDYYLEAVGRTVSVFSAIDSKTAPSCFQTPTKPQVNVTPKCYGYAPKMEISWCEQIGQDCANIVVFNILRKAADEADYSPLPLGLGSNLSRDTHFFPDPVGEDKGYSYIVEAVGSGSIVSSDSTPEQISLACSTIPPAPPVLSLNFPPQASVLLGNVVSLGWTDAGNEESYRIFRWLAADYPADSEVEPSEVINGGQLIEHQLVVLPGGDEDSWNYIDYTVLENTIYVYKIMALNPNGGTWSGIVTATVPIAPPGDFTLTITRQGSDIKLSWSPAAFSPLGGQPVYNLYRDISPDFIRDTDGDFSSAVQVCAQNIQCDGIGTPCVCYDNVPPTNARFYRVTATNVGGSKDSNVEAVQFPMPHFQER